MTVTQSCLTSCAGRSGAALAKTKRDLSWAETFRVVNWRKNGQQKTPNIHQDQDVLCGSCLFCSLKAPKPWLRDSWDVYVLFFFSGSYCNQCFHDVSGTLPGPSEESWTVVYFGATADSKRIQQKMAAIGKNDIVWFAASCGASPKEKEMESPCLLTHKLFGWNNLNRWYLQKNHHHLGVKFSKLSGVMIWPISRKPINQQHNNFCHVLLR